MKNGLVLLCRGLLLHFVLAVSCLGLTSAMTFNPAANDALSRINSPVLNDSLGRNDSSSRNDSLSRKDTLSRKSISEEIHFKPTIFKVDKWDVPSHAELDRMAKVVNQVREDSSVVSWNLTVTGAASPEGRLSHNILLGRNRARQLSDYLMANVPGVDSSNMVVINAEEAWDSLVEVLDSVDFDGKEKVLEIIASQPDREQRKTEIIALDGGIIWARLVKELFPQLRYARVCVHLEKPAPLKQIEQLAHASVPQVLLEQPQSPYEITRTITPHPQKNWFIAVKTNALFLTALTSNLGFEVGFARRWSFDVPVWYSPYDITETLRLRLLAVQPELRFWLKDNGWQGHFFGLHGSAIGYNVSINGKGRFQDPNSAAWGLGLGYGYAMCFGKQKRFGLEFNIGAGFVSYKYDVYDNRYNGQKFDSGSGCYWGLTRAGISLFYRWY